ncbi:hypothetical protein CLF_110953 [Clonorchis sinensis]|uniref:Peptidase M60 domain-containing protein n=1 Tax=Clonorchis sinensis TaxID=79923 RepID=G7YU39_CLOSI|nr:hypothetical protein CLF_110953 [Clonorchis sinensis]
MFKRKEEEIILRPVQLIIIGRKNPIAPAPVAPIIMSEVQAFGTMLHEALAPQMPPEEPFPVSHYEDQHIRVNWQTDGIEHHDPWLRMPVVITTRQLSLQGQMCSPHGEPIFLQLPAGVNITKQLKNVYKHPYVDLRDPKSIEKFAHEVKKHHDMPWTLVSGDNLITSLLTKDVIKSDTTNVLRSGEYMDKVIKMAHNYRGTDHTKTRKMVFACDVQISVG